MTVSQRVFLTIAQLAPRRPNTFGRLGPSSRKLQRVCLGSTVHWISGRVKRNDHLFIRNCLMWDCRVRYLYFHQLWLSAEHHDRVSIDALPLPLPLPHSEACFDFALGLVLWAHTRNRHLPRPTGTYHDQQAPTTTNRHLPRPTGTYHDQQAPTTTNRHLPRPTGTYHDQDFRI